MSVDPTDTPINMAKLYYEELHKLRSFKSQAIIEGNLKAYFDALQQIFIAISFKLNEDEQIEVEKYFKDIDKWFKMRGGSGSVANQVKGLAMGNAEKKLKEVDKRLIALMHRYNMVFPKIESIGIKKINKRYGLEDEGGSV